MRIAVLFILPILVLPVFVRAADPPTLTAYTLSHDTIYPVATVESGLATTTAIDIAFSEPVKASIKIVSASGGMIKSLYSSSSVTNPTPKIWDGTSNASAQVDDGAYIILISATSTATGLSMTDSSKTITVASSESDSTPPDTPSDTTTVAPAQSSSGPPPEYIPVPILRIITAGDRTVSSSADVAFSAVVYDARGNKRDDAFVSWSFGDGMQRTGANVFHSYYNPGEYVVVVHVSTSDGGNALAEHIITVKDASIKISFVSPRGIALTNNSSRTLDLSLWRLSMGGKEFKIPVNTQILADHTVLFPSQVIELPIANSAFLLYPSGEIAATYPVISQASVQPSSSVTSYKQVQTVEQIINTGSNIQTHEKAVLAPTAAIELAAVGAAVSPVDSKATPVPNSRVSGFFRSPWTLGLLGVIIVAGGAFILL